MQLGFLISKCLDVEYYSKTCLEVQRMGNSFSGKNGIKTLRQLQSKFDSKGVVVGILWDPYKIPITTRNTLH